MNTSNKTSAAFGAAALALIFIEPTAHAKAVNPAALQQAVNEILSDAHIISHNANIIRQSAISYPRRRALSSQMLEEGAIGAAQQAQDVANSATGGTGVQTVNFRQCNPNSHVPVDVQFANVSSQVANALNDAAFTAQLDLYAPNSYADAQRNIQLAGYIAVVGKGAMTVCQQLSHPAP